MATEKIRESAKWLLASFAAVGVTFAAGLQLANIGKLDFNTPGRLVIALIGLVVTVAAIVVAVNAAAEVVTRRSVSLDLLMSEQFATEHAAIDNDAELLTPFDTVGELRTAMVQRKKDMSKKYDAYVEAFRQSQEADASVDTQADVRVAKANSLRAADARYEAARRTAQEADAVKGDVLELASFLHVRGEYDKAKKTIAAAAAAAAVGIVAFAWGANPPAVATIASGEVLPKTPSEVTILFSNPTPETRRLLGSACDLSRGVPAVAMTVKGETYQVATAQTSRCRSAWLTVGPDQGAVVRRLPVAGSK